MSQPVRAIYENGQLRLLDKVNLREGEEVELTFLSEREKFRALMGDLLVEWKESPDAPEDIDEDALMAEIREAFKGQPPLSDVIIAERREGP